MFASDDTIVAIATPPGRGGIGVIRLSGVAASEIAERVLTRRAPLQPRRATLTQVRIGPAGAARPLDHVIVTAFPPPHSYTGEPIVEISAHGSPVVLEAIVGALVDAGARLARPGEFTFRAFLNARIDLAQAEAVGDLIEAATPLQARVAFDQLEGTLSARVGAIDRVLLDLVARLEASLDFPDEGFHFIERHVVADRIREALAEVGAVLGHATRGRLIREGATVVLAGRVNAGKSSLFNALIGQERAIVSETPGTTRDLLTERIDVDGFAITLVDTAGLRETGEAVEREGVARAERARSSADLTLIVIDCSEPLTDEDRCLLDHAASHRSVVVASKSDRHARWHIEGAVAVSTLRGDGLDDVRRAILCALTDGERLRDTAAISNVRHISLLKEVQTSLCHALVALTEEEAPEEFVLTDLHRARATLGEVVGTGASDETLNYIFSHFCIGK